MKYFRSNLSNLASVAASDVVSRGCFFALNIVVARQVSLEDFGVYTLALTLGVWVWAVVDAGLCGDGIRRIANGSPPRSEWSTIVVLRCLIIALAAFLAFTFHSLYRIEIDNFNVYSLILLYLLGMNFFSAWVFRCIHDNTGYLLSYIFVGGMAMVAIFSMNVVEIEWSAYSALMLRNLAWLAGGVLSMLLVFKRLEPAPRIEFEMRRVRTTVPLGLATLLYSCLPLINQLNLLDYDPADLGQFGAIWQIYLMLVAAGGILASLFLPNYSRAVASNSRENEKHVLYGHLYLVLLAVLVIAGGFALLGEELVLVLYGEEYAASTIYITPSALLIASIFFRLTFDAALISRSKYRLMALNGLLAVMMLVLCLSWVREPIQMIWAYVLAEFVLMCLNGFFTFYLRRAA